MALRRELIAKKMTHVFALLENSRLQRDLKKMGKEKEENAQLWTAEQAKWENRAIAEEVKPDVVTVTMKAGEQIGTLTPSLEQSQKGVDALKKKSDAVTSGLGELREGKETADYEQDDLEAKLLRARCEREKCIVAAIHMQREVGKLRGLEKKDSFADLQNHMDEHWIEMRQHLGTKLAECVANAREDQIRDSRSVAGLYAQS